MANDTLIRFEVTLLYPRSVHRRRWEDVLMNDYDATQIAGDIWECDLTQEQHERLQKLYGKMFQIKPVM
jgi:hypothetical protein